LVVDGDTLSYALKPSCRKIFSAVAKECYSVICCRVAPLQKVLGYWHTFQPLNINTSGQLWWHLQFFKCLLLKDATGI